MSKMIRSLLVAAATAVVGSTLSAAIVPVRYYKLGENDPGAVAGGTAANPTLAAVGGLNMNKQFSVASFQYSSSVPAASTSGSTLSVNFGAKTVDDTYLHASGVTFQADNWVAEGWFKAADTTGSKNLAFFGDMYGWMTNIIGPLGKHGYGFYQVGDHYYAAFANIGMRDMGVVTPGQWTHLAIVRDSAAFTGDSQGVRLYVNGVQIAMTPLGAAPYVPQKAFSIGGTRYANGAMGAGVQEANNGFVDDVRWSTFTSGAFSPSDLLVVVPEPASLGLMGIAAAGLMARRRR